MDTVPVVGEINMSHIFSERGPTSSPRKMNDATGLRQKEKEKGDGRPCFRVANVPFFRYE